MSFVLFERLGITNFFLLIEWYGICTIRIGWVALRNLTAMICPSCPCDMVWFMVSGLALLRIIMKLLYLVHSVLRGDGSDERQGKFFREEDHRASTNYTSMPADVDELDEQSPVTVEEECQTQQLLHPQSSVI